MKRVFWILIVMLNGNVAGAAESLSIGDYLKEVESENLTIKANNSAADAAESRAVGLPIPPPMVALTQMRDSSGRSNGFEVSQSIPFPTKLSNDSSARKYEAAAEKANASGTKREVLAKARMAFFSTWVAQERIQFLKEKKEAIQIHLRLSTASTRSDSSLKIHTLKAESDLDLLENELVEADQNLREQQIVMAEWARKNPGEYRPFLSRPEVTAIPNKDLLSTPVQLDVKRLTLSKLGARESEAKSNWYPDFNLRYREVGSTPMTPGFQELMVGASLPFVFFWEPSSSVDTARAERLKGEAEYNQEKLRIESRVSSLLSRAASLKKQMELITDRLIPRAEKRVRLVHNLAPRDMESLQDHREAMEAFPDLKLKSLEIRLQYEATISELSVFLSEVLK